MMKQTSIENIFVLIFTFTATLQNENAKQIH